MPKYTNISDLEALTSQNAQKSGDRLAQYLTNAANNRQRQAIADQEAALQEKELGIKDRSARNQEKMLEQNLRKDALDIWLKGAMAQQKPMTTEAAKVERLAQEGLGAAERLKGASKEHPVAHAYATATEGLGAVPWIGDMLQNAAVGIGNLVSPSVGEVAADREKLARAKIYLDSGASAPEKEVQGVKRQTPGVTASPEQTAARYDTFTEPMRQASAMARRPEAPSVQMDPAAIESYLRKGGSLPSPSQAAPQAPAQPQVDPRRARLEELRRKKAGQ